MAKFSTHTFVHDGLVSHSFAPGDEVPGWADGLVGPHVLVHGVNADHVEEEEDTPSDAVTPAGTEDELDGDADSESNDESKSDTEVSKPKAAAAPDFTGSAPRRRQPRK